ncbi:MAG TPA: DUF5985 family protein [Candidatus Paceibacterota bacterium]|nr:DUF5985 family protein [Candidatus Paceibacterota bacterium]
MNEANFTHVNLAISGAVLIGYWAIGLFFFRFRRKDGDRFFLYFGWAFWILALERVLLLAIGAKDEVKPYVYLFRLVAFLFILYAIFDKNRHADQSREEKSPSSDRNGAAP